MNIMIDIETLGTNTDSQVISIGAVAFTLDGDIRDRFYTGISPDYGENIPCTMGTIAFWMKQPEEARANLLQVVKEGVPEREALEELAAFISGWPGRTEVWANGTKFDLGMLEHLFRKHEISVPWSHNADRCMRTLRFITGKLYSVNVYNEIPPLENAHDALADAEYQARYVCKALEIIKAGV